MLYIGLTGNIATGKSEVTRVLAEKGATVIDADILAREAVKVGSEGLKKIVARWGEEILRADGSLDRGALRRIVFESPEALAHLNSIVHPAVEALRARELNEARQAGVEIVVYAVPLLFEVKLEETFDRVVLIDAPQTDQLARLTKIRGLSESEARNMIAAQMPAHKKRPRSDYVLENNGTLRELHQKIDDLWAWLTLELKRGSREKA